MDHPRVLRGRGKFISGRHKSSMRGSIKKRATWQITVDLGLQPFQRCPACRKRYWTRDGRLQCCPKCHGPLEDGRARRQEFHSGFVTKKEAEAELAKLLAAIAGGTHIEASRLTVDDYLTGHWLPAVRPTIRLTTFLSYESHITNYLVPELGRTPLQELSAAQVNAFYRRLLTEPRKTWTTTDPKKLAKETRPLSPATVRRIHATLRRALRDAVRWNLTSRNPASAADPPRAAGCTGARVETWSPRELKTLLARERGSRLYPLWVLFLTTGLRRGEALGLRWQDVDLDARALAVRQTRVQLGYEAITSTPKTQKGKRLVALDAATCTVLTRLKERSENECARRGRSLEAGDVLFTTEDGTPLQPERVSRLFGRAAKRAGVLVIRLHDLRHTHATLALSAGIHPKVVSERLGHANVGITLDVYSHCLPALSEEAASRVAALVLSE